MSRVVQERFARTRVAPGVTLNLTHRGLSGRVGASAAIHRGLRTMAEGKQPPPALPPENQAATNAWAISLCWRLWASSFGPW